MAHVDLPLGPLKLTTYLEQDFMRSTTGVPFRWRQYLTEAKIGNWEVLGGQTWSLLRPNRVGIEPERSLMNTEVIEPNYQIGLVGLRKRQVRLSYSGATWETAIAWEGEKGLWVGKHARDWETRPSRSRSICRTRHMSGISLAQVVQVTPKLRFVGQQFASKGDLTEALGIVPRGVSGASSVYGAEASTKGKLRLFGYYGFVYGARSDSNRLTRQYLLSASINDRRRASRYPCNIRMSIERFGPGPRDLWTTFRPVFATLSELNTDPSRLPQTEQSRFQPPSPPAWNPREVGERSRGQVPRPLSPSQFQATRAVSSRSNRPV